MKPAVLIQGLGTVGANVARAVLSTGYFEVHGTKYSASDDLRTRRVSGLNRQLGPFPIYVADGDNREQRVSDFRNRGFKLLDELDLSRYHAIIDATEEDTVGKFVPMYRDARLPFLVQGGTPDELVGRDFLSAPQAIGQKSYTAFLRGGSRQVSCNTTWVGTACGQILSEYQPEQIRSVEVQLRRRFADPEQSKPATVKPEMKPSHVGDDAQKVYPQLSGKITVLANTNPWKHFHRSDMIVKVDGETKPESVAEAFRTYARCIYVERDFGATHPEDGIALLRAVSDKLGINDADILLPVYNVGRDSTGQLRISGYTPQRSIVALSNLDWLWGAIGMHTIWSEAFESTNRDVFWYGRRINSLKAEFESALNRYLSF